MAIEPERINVLLIEDNPGDARLIIEYLSPAHDQKFNVAVAEKLGAGLKMLEKLSFDVVLLDLTLPDSDGLGTVEKFHDRMPLIPVIVLTGLDDEATGVAAVKAGAQDYLLKGEVNRSILVRTVRYSVERASLERQILESNQTLEERVELRTQELEAAQERASKSEKLAIIGQLSGGVAHDLRNPLGAIKNAAYYLKKKCDSDWSGQNNERISQWLELIDAEVSSANDVITNLLVYGSDSEPIFSRVEIGDIIKFTLDNFPPSENIQISLNIDAGLPHVLGDESQLTRVMQNLVSNAREAMGDGGCLSISAQRLQGSVAVVISDTGEGVDPENLEKIFEPLYTDKIHGTGLGLAICQEIIGKHNGSISVESAIGTGTSFTVIIPIAE